MDIVDVDSSMNANKFYGNTNEQDILNTQLAVLNRLYDVLNRGTLAQDNYQLDSNPNNEPFTDRFENKLAGWVGTFDVIIPNEMTACDGVVYETCLPGHYVIKNTDNDIVEQGYINSGHTEIIVLNDIQIGIYVDNLLQDTINIPYSTNETINVLWQ